MYFGKQCNRVTEKCHPPISGSYKSDSFTNKQVHDMENNENMNIAAPETAEVKR